MLDDGIVSFLMAGENIWSRNDPSPYDFNRATLSGNQQGVFVNEAVDEIFVILSFFTYYVNQLFFVFCHSENHFL